MTNVYEGKILIGEVTDITAVTKKVDRCHSGFGFPGLRHPRVIYPRGFGIPVPNSLSGFGIPRGIWYPRILAAGMNKHKSK